MTDLKTLLAQGNHVLMFQMSDLNWMEQDKDHKTLLKQLFLKGRKVWSNHMLLNKILLEI